MPTTRQFTAALKAISKPSPRVLTMLRHHVDAPNHASIARELAKAAGYVDWRGFNSQYGRLAKRVGEELGLKPPFLSKIVNLIEPGELRNEEWLVLMRKEFATALKRAGWV
jgi:hypothetical protein